MPEAN